MNTKKQKIILITSIIVIIACTIISIKIIFKNNTNSSTNSKYDINNAKILKDTKIDNLSVTNANITINDDVSNYTAIITNESENNYYIKSLYIAYTIDGLEHKLLVLMDTTLSPKEKQKISAAIDTNIKDITKIDYIIE